MSRLAGIFWLFLVVAAGGATFTVKYAVQDIEEQLNRVRKQTIAEQQEVRVLNAEWTYLNQPERLAELNRRFLSLAPVSARQLQHAIESLPLREPATPDMVVAAAPAIAAPIAATAPAVAKVPLQKAAAKSAAPIRYATASPPGIASLNALIAQVAEAR